MTLSQAHQFISEKYKTFHMNDVFEADLIELLQGYDKLLDQDETLAALLPFLDIDPELFFEILNLLYYDHDWKTLKFFLDFKEFHGLSLASLSDNEQQMKALLLVYSPEKLASVIILANCEIESAVDLLENVPSIEIVFFYLKKYGFSVIRSVHYRYRIPFNEILNGNVDYLLSDF